MKKIASVLLLFYALILFGPLTFAATETSETEYYQDGTEYFCPNVTPLKYDIDDKNEEEISNYIETLDDFYGETSKSDNRGECGVSVNKTTQLLEKGDCTASGQVVTEVSEFIGEDIKLDESNKIVTVYKGTCCLIGEYDNGKLINCGESRQIYTLSYDACSKSAINCERRQWIIGTSGANIIKLYVKQIYIWASGTIGFVAVVTMVISGIQISVSGVSGDITQAKDRIIKSIAAIVLLFLSGLLLYTINPTFFF